MSDFDASLRSLAFRRWRRERALDLASRAPQRYVKGASAEPSLGLGSRDRFGRSEGDSGVVGLCPVADDEQLACGYGALFNQPLGGHRRSPPRRRRYPAQIPHEVVGSPRRCPPIAGRRREKSPAIAANPRVAPVSPGRPYPACHAGGRGFESRRSRRKCPANRQLSLPTLAQSTAGFPTGHALIPHASRKRGSVTENAANHHILAAGAGSRPPVIPRRSRGRIVQWRCEG